MADEHPKGRATPPDSWHNLADSLDAEATQLFRLAFDTARGGTYQARLLSSHAQHAATSARSAAARLRAVASISGALSEAMDRQPELRA